ncbi:hypothetical protein diail_8888 [Diaporthe ilicicola]|nr:hypothetical protein diail_8888 [Diaporthe ilicicola]
MTAATSQASKTPSVIFYNDASHIFASTVQDAGYSLVYFTFTDFAEANSSTFHYEVFYFAPQGPWYLVYQNGNATYSTNADVTDPAGWSALADFYPAGVPAAITDNIGDGYWVDMWTPLADFPTGMSEPVIAMQESTSKYALYEASNVYSVGNGTFLLHVEAIDSASNRYFRSWTAQIRIGSLRSLLDRGRRWLIPRRTRS